MTNLTRAAEWSDRLAKSENSLWLIFVASLLESTVVPIPLEIVLIPYLLVNRERVWLISTVTLAGCLVGALVGYSIGLLLFDSVGQWLINAFDYQASFESFRNYFQEQGFWAIVAVGVTPIPFQVAMLTAGVASYPIVLFVLAAALARGIRYYGLALLVLLFGEQAKELWQRHSVLVGMLLLLLIVGYFVIQGFVA